MRSEDDLTLVTALARLPRDEDRGFRFIGLDRKERFFSFSALEAEAYRRAGHLAALGMQKGDRVALIIPEPHEFVLSFLGAVVAGVVPVPIFPRASFKNVDAYVDVLAHIVATSGARLALCMQGNQEVVETLLGRDTSLEALMTAERAFVGDPPAFTPPAIVPDDLCFLQFTSGSTSHPKGVTVSHANVVANTTAMVGPGGIDRRDDDVAVSWLPLFHDMGLIGFVLATVVGNINAVLMPTELFGRSPAVWLEAITKYRGTLTYAPNFAYQLVTRRLRGKDISELDLSALRVAGCGAEPIRAQTLLDFAEALAPAGFRPEAFLPSYGMAESTLAITFHDVEAPIVVDYVDPGAMKQGRAVPVDAARRDDALALVGCGRPFPGHAVRVVGEDGAERGEREVGEILVRGPSVTRGYFANPDATAAALREAIAQTVNRGFGLTPSHVAVCPVGTLPKTTSGKVQRRKTKAAFEDGTLVEHAEKITTA